jgi:hypothetical protein
MFIKILTPNHNGKIELTVRDLEALIQEAVDKALSEHCTKCYKSNWWGSTGITYAGNPVKELENPVWDPYRITCTDKTTDQNLISKNIADNTISLNGGLTIAESDNSIGTTTCASSFTRKVNQLIGD